MEEKGFCLKWEKFLEVCKGMFSQLLKNEQFTDVTLFCEGRLIRCHRLVLSASSQYFQRLLVELNQPNPVIAMQNIKLQDLLAIITFVYTGEVTVAQEQLASLVKLGEMLKVKGLGENDEEDMPPVQHNVKKNVSVSNFEKSDSEIGSVKRRRLESDIGNGLTQFEQCQELLRVEQNDDTAQLYAHSILVKEESSTLDLEPESNESLVHDDKDMDFTTYEDQDLAGPSADFKDTSFHDTGDPGEGSSFANNSQDSQIEGVSENPLLDVAGTPSESLAEKMQRLVNIACSGLQRIDFSQLSRKEALELFSSGKCLVCDVSIKQRCVQKVRDHYIIWHENIVTYIPHSCPECGAKKKTGEAFRKHMREYHNISSKSVYKANP